MSFDIEKFVFIDNHAHSISENFREMDKIAFRQSFSESRSISILENHITKNVHYIDLLLQLKRFFDVKSEEEYLEYRSTLSQEELIQTLWDDVSIGSVIIDGGFGAGEFMSRSKLGKLSGRPCFHCRRIEPILEQCIEQADSFANLSEQFLKKLFDQSTESVTALKSICGYRGGLKLLQATKEEAEKDFDKLKLDSKGQKKIRIHKRPLYHYLLLQAFLIAGEQNIPVQIHSGIGDDDADLVECNPALLQNIFRGGTYSKTQFVLLHCYPYVREAAFMCSLYGNVHMDLSLAISHASGRAARMVADALSLAPATKLMAGSDGHSCPETHWYGALSWKRALTQCLCDMINGGLVTQREAETVGGLILHDNAIQLYKLTGLI
jgi:predicted TIM-barrel fold metal-dependent hydrolase